MVGMKSKMEIKLIDDQGRLVLPKEWRQKYAKKRRIILRIEGEKIIIEPLKLPDLTKFFDSIEAEIKSDLSNWKSVRRELLEIR